MNAPLTKMNARGADDADCRVGWAQAVTHRQCLSLRDGGLRSANPLYKATTPHHQTGPNPMPKVNGAGA